VSHSPGRGTAIGFRCLLTVRQRRAALAAAVLVLATAAGCGSKGVKDSPPPSSPDDAPPILTGAGVPAGEALETTIGPDGGELVSSDGKLKVSIPAGALTKPTDFSVQSITLTALGGVGGGYRLRPEGALAAPVTLTFKGPGMYEAGTNLDGLGIAYQDASGFWFQMKGVVRDASANTLTVTTTHFSDWGVVWAAGVPGMYGNFSVQQTVGIPFSGSGTAVLFYQGSNATKTLYVLTGSMDVPASFPYGTLTCSPDRPTSTLLPNVAEVWTTPSQFRWAINDQWSLTCTDSVGVARPDFMSAVFDTLGINLINCARGYVGTPTIASDHLAGTYKIDCGTDGNVTATWDFIPCIPGVKCSDPKLNPCHTQAISCDTGLPVCTDTGTPIADGTSCGTYLVCSAGTCICNAGASCPGQDVCHSGTVACDASGVPTCAQTALPDGTSCGTTMVCTTGVCKTLSSIAVTPANPSVLENGFTQQFTATGTYSDSTTQNLTSLVTWASSSTAAATIAAGGLATTVKFGTSTISATLNGVTGSTMLRVLPTLLSIAVTPANPNVPLGLTQQFTATGTYSDGSTQNLTASVSWASSSTTAATIVAGGASGGLATTVATGTTTISATSGTVTGSTTLTVLAPALVSIAVTPASPSVVAGLTQQFTATGTYTNGSTQDLTATATWASTNVAAATIVAGGLARGVAVGTTTISATSGTVTGSTSVTVLPPLLVSIAVTPASPSVAKGLTQQFTATGTYTDGSTQNLTATATWASSSAATATIAAGGLATTLAVGTTTISATSGTITGNATLNVLPAALVSIAVTPAAR